MNKQIQLRNTLGQFATGVTIVTSTDQAGSPIGMTVNSFSSVSLEPPLVLWCLGRDATRYDEFATAKYYNINILSKQQQELSTLFANRSWDATVFDEVTWKKNANGIPLIDNTQATLECEVTQRFDGGDHLILMAQVYDHSHQDDSPLIFYNGQYRQLAE